MTSQTDVRAVLADLTQTADAERRVDEAIASAVSKTVPVPARSDCAQRVVRRRA